MEPAISSSVQLRRRRATVGGVIYFLLATAALVAPIHTRLGNHIEPRVLGLPWSLVWVLGIIFANFLVLLALHRAGLVDHRDR